MQNIQCKTSKRERKRDFVSFYDNYLAILKKTKILDVLDFQ